MRKDRSKLAHGGVCIYLKEDFEFLTLDDESRTDFESLWIKIRPHRLPRGFSSVVIGAIYHPPSADKNLMIDHLTETITSVESTNANCGLVIAGDFNHLPVTTLLRLFRLKQLVNFPTRGPNTLDLLLNNLHQFYDKPTRLAPFGLSDHMTVSVQPKSRPKSYQKTTSTVVRKKTRRSLHNLGVYFSTLDWDSLIPDKSSCEEKLQIFNHAVKVGLDTCMPLQSVKISNQDPPWISSHLKDLIKKRQKALSSGNKKLFNFYRNKVNRERKCAKSSFYQDRVQHLKSEDPKNWWKYVKKLCGLQKSKSSSLHFNDLSDSDLANEINNSFINVMQNYLPLNPTDRKPSSGHPAIQIPPLAVFNKLTTLNPDKSAGPDDIPCWLLKEYADILATPISSILNSSFTEENVPSVWKSANVVPIPKVKPVKDINNDLRPISLTPVLAKLAEEFVIERQLKQAMKSVIKDDQFGGLDKSSAPMALLSMLHNWSSNTDGNGSCVRTILFDFRKAFDLVDHQILVKKLQHLNISIPTLNWIMDFLTNRRQRVKVNTAFSEWQHVPAGVPQGSKLGPWLFLLMINDLSITPLFTLWKYIDDTTLSETIKKGA